MGGKHSWAGIGGGLEVQEGLKQSWIGSNSGLEAQVGFRGRVGSMAGRKRGWTGFDGTEATRGTTGK